MFKHAESHQEPQAKCSQNLLAANSDHIDKHYIFSHERSTLPPSLTLKESIDYGNMDKILDCIFPADLAHKRPVTTTAVLDEAVPFWKSYEHQRLLQAGVLVELANTLKDKKLPHDKQLFTTIIDD